MKRVAFGEPVFTLATKAVPLDSAPPILGGFPRLSADRREPQLKEIKLSLLVASNQEDFLIPSLGCGKLMFSKGI
jgi:hypothetical protein